MSAPARTLRAGLLAAALAAGAAGQPVTTSSDARRGPIEAREEWLLTQGRLALPAAAPDLLRPGEARLRLDFDWGNDFGHRSGRYFVDGEHRALAATYRRGVLPWLSLGARLPLLWRGGGFLDRFADAIHTLGFPDNARPLFPRDRLFVMAVDRGGRRLALPDEAGSGLGRLELEARLGRRPRAGSRTELAVSGRVALPGGSGPFHGGAAAAGVQALAAFGVGARFDLYLGIGLSLGDARRRDGFEYPRARGFSHLALEWRLARRWSALVQADVGGRLITNVPGYPSLQSYLRFGLKRDFGARLTAEAAFSENIKSQQATTDFGLYLALLRRF